MAVAMDGTCCSRITGGGGLRVERFPHPHHTMGAATTGRTDGGALLAVAPAGMPDPTTFFSTPGYAVVLPQLLHHYRYHHCPRFGRTDVLGRCHVLDFCLPTGGRLNAFTTSGRSYATTCLVYR